MAEDRTGVVARLDARAQDAEERGDDGVMLCQGCQQVAHAMWQRRSEWLS